MMKYITDLKFIYNYIHIWANKVILPVVLVEEDVTTVAGDVIGAVLEKVK